MRRRTRGERFGHGPRRDDRAAPTAPERATNALAASAHFVLASADLDLLRVLWRRVGGDVREFADGSIRVYAPNGGEVTRGDRAHIEDQLRVRLARRNPLTLVPA